MKILSENEYDEFLKLREENKFLMNELENGKQIVDEFVNKLAAISVKFVVLNNKLLKYTGDGEMFEIGDRVKITNPTQFYEHYKGKEGFILNISRDLLFVNIEDDKSLKLEGFYIGEVELIKTKEM